MKYKILSILDTYDGDGKLFSRDTNVVAFDTSGKLPDWDFEKSHDTHEMILPTLSKARIMFRLLEDYGAFYFKIIPYEIQN